MQQFFMSHLAAAGWVAAGVADDDLFWSCACTRPVVMNSAITAVKIFFILFVLGFNFQRWNSFMNLQLNNEIFFSCPRACRALQLGVLHPVTAVT